jgi:hypothetical protein
MVPVENFIDVIRLAISVLPLGLPAPGYSIFVSRTQKQNPRASNIQSRNLAQADPSEEQKLASRLT